MDSRPASASALSLPLEYKEKTHKRQDAAEKTAFFTGEVGGFFKAEGQKIGEGCGKKEQKAVGHM